MTPRLKDLKHMVKGDQTVNFTRYHDGALWYRLNFTPPPTRAIVNFEFPVPVSDIGSATFLAEDRAILFMRYIRKYLQTLEEARGPA